jgi:hypothetical protein
MSYKFRPDNMLSDKPFKERVDNNIELCKNILVVGWRQDSGYDLFDYLTTFANVHLVEIFQPYLDKFIKNHPKLTIECNDIRNIDQSGYDGIIWQHGPEHLTIDQSNHLINDWKKTARIIVVEVPNGVCPQESNINTAENHISTWYAINLVNIGFDFRHYGPEPHSANWIIGMWMYR